MKQNDWLPRLPNNTLGFWLETSRQKLGEISETPALEVQLIAAHVLDKPRAWLLAHPEEILSAAHLTRMDEMLAALAAGAPLAYLTGEREFFGLRFIIRPGLLVPRPETELLVETALDWLQRHPERRTAVDVGCGSGCIAVTLAARVTDLQIDALDIDPLAVETTIQNAGHYANGTRVIVFQSDLLTATRNTYDLICANLPYIPTEKLSDLPAARFEPYHALDGGRDGLYLIGRLLEQAVSRLRPQGLILLEIEATLGESILRLSRRYFPKAKIDLLPDLAGLPRLVCIQDL
ncbi:MAG: peptide chain release factor N(5)-glutamine methyltransferase [Leptolinea sp.]|jgi:release factor glutamine methyltransferase|nr:peptide chain release factor N(5)-glutamine methyltransferase [Leptolinea sp.]